MIEWSPGLQAIVARAQVLSPQITADHLIRNDYLRRFHEVKVACSTVHRILIRHGLGRLPANQKHRPKGRPWKRYEKPQPGHRLQLDVKFLERIAGTPPKRLYQFTAIDDCTRIRVLKIDVCNQASAIRFVDEVLRRLPFRV
jgi:hypothetical protein